MMMNMDQFAEAVKNEVTKRLDDDYEIFVEKTLVNNGVIKNQLSIKKRHEQYAPSIRLEDYFEDYKEGQELHTVVDHLLALYDSNGDIPDCIQTAFCDLSYEKIKDRIMFKLVNTHNNEELLKEIPSFPYLNLSIVFYIYVGEEDEMKATALIKNVNMELWNVTKDDLYQEALINTPKRLPPVLYRVEDIIRGTQKNLIGEQSVLAQDEYGYPVMLALSNKSMRYGAATLLYPGIMKQCKEKIGKDFIIFPSSLDEILLLPILENDDDLNSRDLAMLVKSINDEDVPVVDRLANCAYRYHSDDDFVFYA